MKLLMGIFYPLVFILSCQNKNVSNLISEGLENTDVASHFTDTVYILKFHSDRENMNPDEVREAAIQLFKKEGAKTIDEIDDYALQETVVEVDTFFILKTINIALVKFWLKPVDVNGTCVNPLYALLAKTNGKYWFTNRDFIDTDFYLIDSVQRETFYGRDWDCSKHEAIAFRTITIRAQN